MGQSLALVMFFANATPDWSVVVGQFGIAGVLGFILVKLEPRLKAIEVSSDMLSRSMLLLVVALDQANDATKQSARSLIRTIDAKYPAPHHEPPHEPKQ